MKSKIDKLEKKIHKLNAKELRQVERIINQRFVREIKKKL